MESLNMKSKYNINRNKWIKFIFNDNEIVLTDIEGVIFSQVKKTEPNGKTETISITGVDGGIPQYSSYDAFELEVEILFRGEDKHDLDLFLKRLNSIIQRKHPYYVAHSDMPRLVYAVEPTPKITYDFISIRDYKIQMAFTCFKGYSETQYDTSHYNLGDGSWQFETKALADDEYKYLHYTKGFYIYNGSDDIIDPALHNKLQIDINAEAPNGLEIKNLTNGSTFKYNDPLRYYDNLVLDGIYAKLDGNRVGINTNWQWIILEKGFNKIEISGRLATKIRTHWKFPFIFRY